MPKDHRSKHIRYSVLVRDILKKKKSRKEPLDYWLAAVASVLGEKELLYIMKSLAIASRNDLTPDRLSSLPILESSDNTHDRDMFIKYLIMTETDEGAFTTKVLLEARNKYDDYLSSDLPKAEIDTLLTNLSKDLIHTYPALKLSIEEAFGYNYIICMECGAQFRTLAKHLQAVHGITQDAYRNKHGIGEDVLLSCREHTDSQDKRRMNIRNL